MKKECENVKASRPSFVVGWLAALLLVAAGAWNVRAQEAGGFSPQGKPIIVLFTDYTLGDGDDGTGFNLTRSRFGYEYRPVQSLKATVVVDVNATEGIRGANFHYAMLEWEYKRLTLGGGLIALSQFGVQESFWGKRYIEKSFQDLNGFGFDSDLGLIAKYRFTDWLDADLAVTNGEGTTGLNADKSNRYGAGITLRPLEGLTLRAYADTYSEADWDTDQQTLALFAGYGNRFFSVGAEYNYQKDFGLVNGYDLSGYSFYAAAPLGAKAALYARYDYLNTDTDDLRRTVNKDLLIAGFEYRPIPQLSLSPNYRYMKSAAGEGRNYLVLNLGFSW